MHQKFIFVGKTDDRFVEKNSTNILLQTCFLQIQYLPVSTMTLTS